MNSIAKTLAQLRLIPDSLEFLEFKIDHYINWLTQDDPNSILTTKEMIELDAQIAFLQQRRQALAEECDRLICDCLEQFKQDCVTLQQTKPSVIRIGAPHQIETREKHWHETHLNRLETARDRELNVIRGRYISLIQECDHWLDRTQQRLTETHQRNSNTSLKMGEPS